MTLEQNIDAIYQAKLEGLSDEIIMKKFSIGLKDIESAVIRKTGVNLNLFADKPKIARLSPKSFHLESETVWSFKSRGKWATHNGNYRGNWSPYIPRNLILRYSKPGDLVLDQFCGGGTTAVEAKLLGRKCITRDINPSSILVTNRNLDFPISTQTTLTETDELIKYYDPTVEIGDARNLEGIRDSSIDLICTHPPYANIVQYSENLEGDISHHDVEEFIEDMEQVAQECYRVLKPEGTCAILIGDTRRNKRVVPMGFRTIEAFQKQGFRVKDLIIKRQHNCRTTGFWYTNSIKHNFLLLAQEYLPIFTKSDSSVSGHSIQNMTASYDTEHMEIPPAPLKMECKTTWVLPHENKNELLISNMLNRYGKDGKILKISPSRGQNGKIVTDSNKCSLIYVDSLNEDLSENVSMNEITSSISNLIESLSSLVADGGHLIIRIKDIKQGEYTSSPVLKIWKMPDESFRITEIIVVTPETQNQHRETSADLEINHEYLLVYQKS